MQLKQKFWDIEAGVDGVGTKILHVVAQWMKLTTQLS